jgi:hypothetical protein
MNTANPSVLFRSLIVYAICVPLAIFVGYLLTNPQDLETIGFIGVMAAILVFPLLMRFHYPLLIFSWNLPVTLFFLPGHPSLFYLMVLASLSISVVERILDRNQPFLPASAVRWPLLAFLALIIITAKLTGGFGLRSMGSDVYGGKKYVGLVIGIMSFFAITARPIPKRYAGLYVTLWFAGSFFNAISDFYSVTPQSLRFIFVLIPPSNSGLDEMGNLDVVLGQTRLAGIAGAAGSVWCWMLARHGFRNCFLTPKLWRPVTLVAMLPLVMLGGFRSAIIGLMLITGLMFYMEKIHRTGLMLALVLAGIMGSAMLVPLAPHLPFTFQRALAFLPLDISPEARMNAETSTEWRLEIWRALLPQIPNYLLIGKGYAFSAEIYNEEMGANSIFHGQKVIDASQNALALSSDFHSGPLSLIIPFGIWGVLLWLWYLIAGFFVVWRNYRNGNPDLGFINRYLYVVFIVKCITFVFIFGDLVGDMAGYAAIIGLSIALNHGIGRPQPIKKPLPAKPRPYSQATIPVLAQ